MVKEQREQQVENLATIRYRLRLASVSYSLLAMLFLLPLIVYAYTGTFSRYAVDDFDLARREMQFGVWGNLRHYYLFWCGRYSFLLLISALSKYLPGMVWFLPSVLLLLLAGGLYALFAQWVRRLPALVVSLIVINATLRYAPALRESLYWECSSLTYLPPITGLCWSAAYLIALSRRPVRFPDYAIAMLLPFINAGFSETVTALQIPIYSAILLWAWRKPLRNVAICGIAGAVTGLMVLLFAPGNAIREAFFPHHAALWVIVKQSAGDTAGFLISTLSFRFPDIFDIAQWEGQLPIAFSVFFFAFLAGCGAKQETQSRKRLLLIALLLCATLPFMLLLCFLPARFGMSAILPGRAQVIPCFLLAVTFSLIGICLGGLFSTISSNRTPAFITGVAFMGVWLLLNVSIPETRVAMDDLPQMRAFAVRWDLQDVQYRAAALNRQNVVVVGLDPYQGNFVCTNQSRWDVAAERAYYRLPTNCCSR